MEQPIPPERARRKLWLRVPVLAGAWLAWAAAVLAGPGRVAAAAALLGVAGVGLTALTVVALWRLGFRRAP